MTIFISLYAQGEQTTPTLGPQQPFSSQQSMDNLPSLSPTLSTISSSPSLSDFFDSLARGMVFGVDTPNFLKNPK